MSETPRGVSREIVVVVTSVEESADPRDATIRARLQAEAGRTEAALRELAQRGRSRDVRAGAAMTLRRLVGDAAPERSASRAREVRDGRLSLEAIKQMREVMREIAPNDE